MPVNFMATQADVDEAVRRRKTGEHVSACCPMANILSAHLGRPVTVSMGYCFFADVTGRDIPKPRMIDDRHGLEEWFTSYAQRLFVNPEAVARLPYPMIFTLHD